MIDDLFPGLPIDAGGSLPRPPKEYANKAAQFLWQNKLPIGLFLIGLVIA